MTKTDTFLYVVLIIGCFFYPMAMQCYMLDRQLKHKPVGLFFKCLNLSSILTMITAVCQWCSIMRHGPCTLNGFKTITKVCIDIAVVILLIPDIIGLFVNMGFYIDAWLSGANIVVLLLSVAHKVAYDLSGAHPEAGTTQKPTPRELENGDLKSLSRVHSENASRLSSSDSARQQMPSTKKTSGQLENEDMNAEENESNGSDENERNGSEIVPEAQTDVRNLVVNSFPDDDSPERQLVLSEANALDPSGPR